MILTFSVLVPTPWCPQKVLRGGENCKKSLGKHITSLNAAKLGQTPRKFVCTPPSRGVGLAEARPQHCSGWENWCPVTNRAFPGGSPLAVLGCLEDRPVSGNSDEQKGAHTLAKGHNLLHWGEAA